jgi:tryptophan synthase alpha chain
VIAGYADAVIVGSALVNTLLAAPDEPAGREALRKLTADLAAGVRQAGAPRPVTAHA